MSSPCFIDIFAGCGGFSLGLAQAGWRGLFAIEKDKDAFQTLHDNLIEGGSLNAFNWPLWLPIGPHDAVSVLEKYHMELHGLRGSVDLLVGGPPCQGFSTAGRRNARDPRNSLIDAYLDYIDLIRPNVAVMENVRGITLDFASDYRSKQGRNYAQDIVTDLSREYVVSSKIVDSSLFGVPQKRHRFLVVAVRRDIAAQIRRSPLDELDRARQSLMRAKGMAAVPVSARTAISDLCVARNGTRPSQETVGFDEIAYRGPLTSYQRLMRSGMNGLLPDTRLARHEKHIANRFARIIELCQADGRLNTSLSAEMRASLGLRKRAIRVLDPDAPSPTITSMPDDLIHYSEPRTLTVRENARLQSFPDWYAFKGKYTSGGDRRRREVPRFTQVANAVPPLVAEAIGLSLIAYSHARLSINESKNS